MAALKTLKIATRQSPLALWQANFVKDQLEKFHPTLSVELILKPCIRDRAYMPLTLQIMVFM